MVKRDNIYDTYWRTAFERQEIFFKKTEGVEPPLTNDFIFQEYKFCNVYRACDRESQYLIRNVIYGKNYSETEVLFRVLFFRLLNRSATWEMLERKLGEISYKDFDFKKYSEVLKDLQEKGPIYGNAFILCANKAFGYEKKYENHLALLQRVMSDSKLVDRLLKSKSMERLYEGLLSLPLIGSFMAYQMAIDLNYSDVFNYDENEFTKAGPGAIRGINKCLTDTGRMSPEEIIMYMVENQDKEFNRLGLKFRNLFGRRMTAIDCQGWFCETDKYCRVSFPELKSNRERIKTKYKPSKKRIEYFFPPKWKLT